MKVLVIPEDQALDQYVVKPIVEAMFEDLGLRARVDVLPEPRLRGASDALDKEVVATIVADNPMEDLFLLLVDRDCDREGNESRAAERQAEHEGRLVACVARQEVEVWLLALYAKDLGAAWKAVRAHCDPKEEWAEALLQKLDPGGVGPGRGRKKAMRALKGQFRALLSRCPELVELRDAVKAWAEARGAGGARSAASSTPSPASVDDQHGGAPLAARRTSP